MSPVPRSAWGRWVERLGAAFAAAVATGALAGILLRIVMYIIALAYPHLSSGFHPAGVIFILLVGTGFTLANSIIFTCMSGVLPKKWASLSSIPAFVMFTGITIEIFSELIPEIQSTW